MNVILISVLYFSSYFSNAALKLQTDLDMPRLSGRVLLT